MDMTDLRSISTVLCFIAIIAVFYWTYHPKRKGVYDDAELLPFGDDDDLKPSSDKKQATSNSKTEQQGEK